MEILTHTRYTIVVCTSLVPARADYYRTSTRHTRSSPTKISALPPLRIHLGLLALHTKQHVANMDTIINIVITNKEQLAVMKPATGPGDQTTITVIIPTDNTRAITMITTMDVISVDHLVTPNETVDMEKL